VTDISKFLDSSFLSHEINLRWSIEVSELWEAEIPVTLVFVWVQSCMLSTVCGSPVIPKPNIVSISDHLESGRDIRVLDDPGRGAT